MSIRFLDFNVFPKDNCLVSPGRFVCCFKLSLRLRKFDWSSQVVSMTSGCCQPEYAEYTVEAGVRSEEQNDFKVLPY